MTRLLGVDVGERRIGLAVADIDTTSVRPLATIRRADPQRDGLTLARLAQEQRIDELIIGLPLNADGSEGAQAQLTRQWADSIAPYVARPIVWRDERLTSEAAEQRIGMRSRGASGGPPSAAARNARRARIDREAAANIVQAEMDARKR
ncbi:MAG TPA: Holliday junction resolvase RuvX [Candidatus Limnocylindrales bacterium]|nr:Holliday junction resolvase RuvX [Candidatus Limnocylindrales bacterium]